MKRHYFISIDLFSKPILYRLLLKGILKIVIDTDVVRARSFSILTFLRALPNF